MAAFPITPLTRGSVNRVDLLKLFVAIICELDVVIYISLIDGLCKMGELDFSIEMQILMVEKGMALDGFTYISLIQRLFDAGLLDEALGSIALTEVLFRQQG